MIYTRIPVAVILLLSANAQQGFLGDFFEQFPAAPFGRVRYPKSYFSQLEYSQKGTEEDSEAEEAIVRPSGKRGAHNTNWNNALHFKEHHRNPMNPRKIPDYSAYIDMNNHQVKSLPPRRYRHGYFKDHSYVQNYNLRANEHPGHHANPLRTEPSFAHIPGPPYEHYSIDEPYRLPESNFWPNAVESHPDKEEEPSFIKSFEKVRTRVNSPNFKKGRGRKRKKQQQQFRRRKPVRTTTLHPSVSIVVSTLPPRGHRRPAIQFLDRTPSSIIINNRARPRRPASVRAHQFEKLELAPGNSSTTTEEEPEGRENEEQENDESVTLKHVEQLLIAILDHQQNQSRIAAEDLSTVPSTPNPIRRRAHPFIQNIQRNPVLRGALGVFNSKAKGLGRVLFPNRRPRANEDERKPDDDENANEGEQEEESNEENRRFFMI